MNIITETIVNNDIEDEENDRKSSIINFIKKQQELNFE
jgi:hypothetical protein